MQSKNFGTLIGSFGKGIAGSVTVNFAPSGGANCDDSCPLKKSRICYAISAETRKPSITVNLEKKAADFSGYLSELISDKAIAKLNDAPWVRFSAFGSIKDPNDISAADTAKLEYIAANIDHTKTHFPVETAEKFEYLRRVGFAPRLSLATELDKVESLVIKGYKLSATIEGPKRAIGKNKRKHSQKAFDTAAEFNARGIKTKVCPAIAGKASCGDCKLCARPDVDLIIYPMH